MVRLRDRPGLAGGGGVQRAFRNPEVPSESHVFRAYPFRLHAMILDSKGNAEASGSSVYRVPTTVDSPPAYHSSRSALIDDASDAEARSSSNEAKLALNRQRRRRRIALFILAVIIYSAALIVFVVKVCIYHEITTYLARSAGRERPSQSFTSNLRSGSVETLEETLEKRCVLSAAAAVHHSVHT